MSKIILGLVSLAYVVAFATGLLVATYLLPSEQEVREDMRERMFVGVNEYVRQSGGRRLYDTQVLRIVNWAAYPDSTIPAPWLESDSVYWLPDGIDRSPESEHPPAPRASPELTTSIQRR